MTMRKSTLGEQFVRSSCNTLAKVGHFLEEAILRKKLDNRRRTRSFYRAFVFHTQPSFLSEPDKGWLTSTCASPTCTRGSNRCSTERARDTRHSPLALCKILRARARSSSCGIVRFARMNTSPKL